MHAHAGSVWSRFQGPKRLAKGKCQNRWEGHPHPGGPFFFQLYHLLPMVTTSVTQRRVTASVTHRGSLSRLANLEISRTTLKFVILSAFKASVLFLGPTEFQKSELYLSNIDNFTTVREADPILSSAVCASRSASERYRQLPVPSSCREVACSGVSRELWVSASPSADAGGDCLKKLEYKKLNKGLFKHTR